jgi:uncharacterized protein YqgC (DUF456 family)
VDTLGLVLVGTAILVGLVGVVLPFLPGAFLVLGAILVWAVVEGSATGWVVFSIALVFTAIAQVLKYTVPGRQLRARGIPNSTLLLGAVVGIVGFFVVPIVGLPIGFVLGIYLAELNRVRDLANAWRATVQALRAVGWSMLIELVGAGFAATTWFAAVVFA